MKQQDSIPSIRFSSYAAAWQRSELGEVADFAKGSGYSKNDLVAQGVPIILYGRLYTNYQTTIEKVDAFVGKLKGTVYSKGTEVLVPASGESSEDIARAAAVSTKGVLIGSDLNIVYPHENLVAPFLALLITYSRANKVLASKAQGKSVVHLHNSDLKVLDISFPSQSEEQRDFAALFSVFDKLIDEQQSKCDRLVSIKKALLGKLFPKEGETVPEIRFTGCTGEWVQKTLKQVSAPLTYGLNVAAVEYDGINKYLRITDIEDDSRRFSCDDITSPGMKLSPQNEERYKLENGDIVFARTGASVGKSYQYRPSDGKVFFAGFLIRARITSDNISTFIFQYTLTGHFQKFVEQTSQRSGQPGINATEYSSFPMLIPQQAEQRKIGQLLCKLDDLITLHQTKLDKLKQLKQAFLERMFV